MVVGEGGEGGRRAVCGAGDAPELLWFHGQRQMSAAAEAAAAAGGEQPGAGGAQ